MPVYVVVPLAADATALDRAVMGAFKEAERLRLQNNRGWLVKFGGTTVEASHHIGITSPDPTEATRTGSALVVPVSSYYGRGPTDMWEWLKIRMET